MRYFAKTAGEDHWSRFLPTVDGEDHGPLIAAYPAGAVATIDSLTVELWALGAIFGALPEQTHGELPPWASPHIHIFATDWA